MTTERSLADEIPNDEQIAGADQSVDSPRPQIDVGEFLSGVRAQRRAVKVRPGVHRLADMQRLVDEIDEAPDAADVDSLIDEYEDAKDEYLTYEWWVVEQRTPERRREVRRSAAKELGIELYEDGETVKEDDPDRSRADVLETRVMLDHIVEPEGLTVEGLNHFYSTSPGEWMKVSQAVVRVQRVLDDEAEKDVLRDFSSRRSGKTGDSSKR